MIPEQDVRESEYFSLQELSKIDSRLVPRHIAIIPDGNRRWAQERGVAPIMGHYMGAERVTDIVVAARDLGVKHITFYAFSTENWGASE